MDVLLFIASLSQNNQYFLIIGIIVLIIFAFLLILPYIGTGSSLLIFVIMLVSGNLIWRIFGLGDEWLQFILVNILFIYLIFYLLYYKLKQAEMWLIQGFSYLLPIFMFGLRFSTPEVLQAIIDLSAISWILGIPLLGAIVSVTIFVIALLQGEQDALVSFGQEGFLAGLLLVIFVYATIFIISSQRYWKVISIIQIICLICPLTLFLFFLRETPRIISLSLTLGPIIVITLLILNYDPLDPFLLFLRDKMQKWSLKTAKERKGKENKSFFQRLKKPETFAKFKSTVKIYASKYKYILFLVIDLVIYFIVSDVLTLWVSVSEIPRAAKYYPELLPLIILLIIIWLGLTYGVLLMIRYVVVVIFKDYFE